MVYLFHEMDQIDEACFQRYVRLLPYERQKRIEKYADFRDRLRSLSAVLLLFYGQIEIFGNISNASWKYNKFGKPFYDNGFHFNFSHKDNYIVCGIAGKPIGVDIEKRFEDSLCRTDFFLSEKEKQYMESCSERNDQMAMLWSVKEAYGKCQGYGLNYDLKGKDFVKHIRYCGELDGMWYYNRMINGYSLAICAGEPQMVSEVHWNRMKAVADQIVEEKID